MATPTLAPVEVEDYPSSDGKPAAESDFRDPVTGRELLSLAENREARERAESERQRERAARLEAEARLAELRAALRRDGGGDAPEGGADASQTS